MTDQKRYSSGGLRFYPFDVESVRPAKTPEEIKKFEELMATRVESSRFEMRMGPMPIGTISQSGGRDDECDQDIIW